MLDPSSPPQPVKDNKCTSKHHMPENGHVSLAHKSLMRTSSTVLPKCKVGMERIKQVCSCLCNCFYGAIIYYGGGA